VQVLPPIRPGQLKYAAARAMEKEQAARAALDQVAGTASDPEVALQLAVLDLPLFRYRGEKARIVPGLEILPSLPMNLERLSAPIAGPEDEVRALDEAAHFFSSLDEHIAANKKADDEDALTRAKELVELRAKERAAAAAKATAEAEKNALQGAGAAAAATSAIAIEEDD
jgi:hypothetical protein